tara:strand:+ start:391 stop:531 length:141 start_codon:yes stop_codon:yes gene_type:complete
MKKGPIIDPFGETLPKKHHKNSTLEDAKLNKKNQNLQLNLKKPFLF